jgi:hypothetical protein
MISRSASLESGTPDTPRRDTAAGMTGRRPTAFLQVDVRFVDKAVPGEAGRRPLAGALATIR